MRIIRQPERRDRGASVSRRRSVGACARCRQSGRRPPASCQSRRGRSPRRTMPGPGAANRLVPGRRRWRRPSTSSASDIAACEMPSGPDHAALMPTTTTSFACAPTPTEQLTTDENCLKSDRIVDPVASWTGNSRSALPTPSAEAARPKAIDFVGLSVAGHARAFRRATMSATPKAGPFTWTKWTSARSATPALVMAFSTATAHLTLPRNVASSTRGWGHRKNHQTAPTAVYGSSLSLVTSHSAPPD